MSWLPRISMGLTLDKLARRLRCAECGGPLQSVKPWREADVLGRPQAVSSVRGFFGLVSTNIFVATTAANCRART